MSKDIKLIVLYGDVGTTSWKKAQKNIDGVQTCGYRDYAEKFGCIIYMTPQKVSKDWEHSIPDPDKVVDFIHKYPDAIVMAIKVAARRDEKILSKVKNRKLYYSCGCKNLYNSFCDISLVDIESRLGKNAKVFVKGKDKNFWKPSGKKEFDYLFIGVRGDKNESFFVNKLNSVKKKRKILWIGGKKHRKKIKTFHDVTYTDKLNKEGVRDNISRAKVGVLFTESGEGFPQSFLEMTMCGVPVVYNIKAPINKMYNHSPNNCVLANRGNLIEKSEWLLNSYDQELCRKIAIDNYSMDKFYERISSL
ncbi:MAG: glycosyltransferase [Clostridiales bacterium]|nr:glycosyltransferase [Clostridiales bacterium]